jgi:hypothetical protein
MADYPEEVRQKRDTDKMRMSIAAKNSEAQGEDVEDRSPIAVEIDRLVGAIEELRAQNKRLYRKLQPIMNPEPQELDSNPVQGPEGNSEVLGRLHDLRIQIMSETEGVISVIGVLEV